jgi:hypothetical protein
MSHDRPAPADMLASLAAARAILAGAVPATVHQMLDQGGCPACTAAAGMSFMIAVISTLQGDTLAVSEGTRRLILAATDSAEADLRAAGN